MFNLSYRLTRLILIIMSVTAISALAADTDSAPLLHHVFDIHAKISGACDEGDYEFGKRIAIPITGGEVRGKVNGIILPGGADRQMIDTVRNCTHLCAIYEVETPDSARIKVRNEGIITGGASDFYFITSPKFECDRNSPYSWLMDRIFVCRPIEFLSDGIVLRVWEVR